MKSLRWKLEIYLSRSSSLPLGHETSFLHTADVTLAARNQNLFVTLGFDFHASKKRPVRKFCVLQAEKLLILIINYQHQTGTRRILAYCINHPRVASHRLIQPAWLSSWPLSGTARKCAKRSAKATPSSDTGAWVRKDWYFDSIVLRNRK